MSILDRFRQRAERIPKEVVKEVVDRSKQARLRNNEYHEAITNLLNRMDRRREERHVEDT